MRTSPRRDRSRRRARAIALGPIHRGGRQVRDPARAAGGTAAARRPRLPRPRHLGDGLSLRPDPPRLVQTLLGSTFLSYLRSASRLAGHLDACSRIAASARTFELRIPPSASARHTADFLQAGLPRLEMVTAELGAPARLGGRARMSLAVELLSSYARVRGRLHRADIRTVVAEFAATPASDRSTAWPGRGRPSRPGRPACVPDSATPFSLPDRIARPDSPAGAPGHRRDARDRRGPRLGLRRARVGRTRRELPASRLERRFQASCAALSPEGLQTFFGLESGRAGF